MDDIRSMIRQILSEEIQALKSSLGGSQKTVHERVDFYGDGDLNAFVKRILDLGRDPQKYNDIMSGRHTFSLGACGHPPAQHYAPSVQYHAPPVPKFEPVASPVPVQQKAPQPSARQEFGKNLMTERDVDNLPEGTRVVMLGHTARLTPLARDELRRLNIRIERKAA
ncbi:hypothetical protein [Rhizobium sp. L1K21]|uniref:hypothetical protein n=1 Tax=Rhizobium sp. L1K21 TaxID=2954933 RepID=UPI0020928ED5|nr:hypothetical protein [Rhizobium sp. L1K21]MCO6185167.1 hypothetical protein [Rhizobium sp. L1K21]